MAERNSWRLPPVGWNSSNRSQTATTSLSLAAASRRSIISYKFADSSPSELSSVIRPAPPFSSGYSPVSVKRTRFVFLTSFFASFSFLSALAALSVLSFSAAFGLAASAGFCESSAGFSPSITPKNFIDERGLLGRRLFFVLFLILRFILVLIFRLILLGLFRCRLGLVGPCPHYR